MRLILFIAAVLLSGCTVNGYEIAKAIATCESHKGVHRLQYGPHKALVVCQDGYIQYGD